MKILARYDLLATIVSLLFIMVIGFLTVTNTVKRVGDYDTLGYVYAGERLAAGHGLTYFDSNNTTIGPYFSLNAMRLQRPANLTFKYLAYPPGVSILIATSILTTGQSDAVHFVVPLLGIIGLVAVYALGRAMTKNAVASFFAVALIVSTPNYWRYSTQTWSEIPSLALLTLGLVGYWHSRNREKHNLIWGALAGLLLGYSVWIRYTNVFVLVGIGLFELLSYGWRIWSERWRWTLYIPILLSLLGILLFNHLYYGGVFLTGYSSENNGLAQPFFSLSYAFGSSFAGGYSAIELAKSLWVNFGFWLILLPFGGWALDKRPRQILLVTTLPILALYSVYAFPAKGINSRFILIAYPALAVTISMGLVYLSRLGLSSQMRVVLLIVVFGAMMWRVPEWVGQAQGRIELKEAEYQQILEWVEPTESNAVFITHLFNDRIAAFGDRSVLNYRHMIPYDPLTQTLNYAQFAPCFIEAIDKMLFQSIPVYYIEDQEPTLYDSLEVLKRNFELELVREGPSIYKVADQSPIRDELDICKVMSAYENP